VETVNANGEGRKTVNAKSLSNLRPFPRGVSGNPGGRPREKGPRAKTLRTLARQFREDIIAGLLDLMWNAEDERTRLAAAIALAEYSDGKPRVAKEDDDEEEDDSFEVSSMSDEELERRLRALDDDNNEEPVPQTPPPDEGEKQEAVEAIGSRFTELSLDDEDD
jgi:hypothetical protein